LKGDEMATGSLTNKVLSLQVVAPLEALIDASKLWDLNVRDTGSLSRSDRKMLNALGERIATLLKDVPSAARAAEKIAKNLVGAPVGHALLTAKSADEKKRLHRLVGPESGFAAALATRARSIKAATSAQGRRLKAQVKEVTGGTGTVVTAEDVFSKEFICDICKAVIILAILLDNQNAYRWAYGQAAASGC
jgi:hypothetical protein